MADQLQEAGSGSLPIGLGKPFPDLVLPAVADGAPRRIADFRGTKLALHLFASW